MDRGLILKQRKDPGPDSENGKRLQLKTIATLGGTSVWNRNRNSVGLKQKTDPDRSERSESKT